MAIGYPKPDREGLDQLTVLSLETEGGNPLSFTTEIIIEIQQLNSGQMASHASIESIWCTH